MLEYQLIEKKKSIAKRPFFGFVCFRSELNVTCFKPFDGGNGLDNAIRPNQGKDEIALEILQISDNQGGELQKYGKSDQKIEAFIFFSKINYELCATSKKGSILS